MLKIHGVFVDDSLPDVVEAVLGVDPIQGLGLVRAEVEGHLGGGQGQQHREYQEQRHIDGHHGGHWSGGQETRRSGGQGVRRLGYHGDLTGQKVRK